MSVSGREALQEVREWSGVTPGCPGVVGRLSRMSGSVWAALKDGRAWSGNPPECPGVGGKPFRTSWRVVRMPGSVRAALSYLQ